MKNGFMQQPEILIVALIISIIVFVATVFIVISLFRAKDNFTDVQENTKRLKKKNKIQVSQ